MLVFFLLTAANIDTSLLIFNILHENVGVITLLFFKIIFFTFKTKKLFNNNSSIYYLLYN